MKITSRAISPVIVLFLALAPFAMATTWYVNGVNGSDNNNCLSSTTACKTIGHAISLASSGDSIKVAAATYTENLTIGISLTVAGSSAAATIIDGGSKGTVVMVSSTGAHVGLSQLTIRNGYPSGGVGGGIVNHGTLVINNCSVTANVARGMPGLGGGIRNIGTLTLSNSTVSGNTVSGLFGAGFGGGLANSGSAAVINSTFNGNYATGMGGAVYIDYGTTVTINNSTIGGNKSSRGGGIGNYYGTAILQNSIVANSSSGGNCYNNLGTITSKGYNLSGDDTCSFNGPGDINNLNPILGPLANNGGPTQTLALLSGSPAIDAGNPNGCSDGQGHLLKTDQHGSPRPDKEDTIGCDIGAYERQSD